MTRTSTINGCIAGCMVFAAASANAWVTDFGAARKRAAEEKKPILANFTGSDWCNWCVRLDREVFDHDAFKKYAADKFVLFVADFPAKKQQPDDIKRQNEALAVKYGVRGFPSILILDAEGKKLAGTGYRPGGPEAYIEHLDELLKNKRD